MVTGEVLMLPEMVAAGIEAMRAAKRDCLEEGQVVEEIYLAMYGIALQASLRQESEAIH